MNKIGTFFKHNNIDEKIVILSCFNDNYQVKICYSDNPVRNKGEKEISMWYFDSIYTQV
ncbi:MAG: hypothetical protein ACM3O3_13070 [Syntrophothermus sp.]